MFCKVKKPLLIVSLITITNTVYAGYGAAVKLTSVESQGTDASIYINGNVGDPAGCAPDTIQSQAFINNDVGMERTYSAALAALASQRDVQLYISSGACKYNKPVVLGIRVN